MKARITDFKKEHGYIVFSIASIVALMRDVKADDGPCFIQLRGRGGWQSIAEEDFNRIEAAFVEYLAEE